MKNKNDFPIDFVVPWVDGSDLEWIKEFNKYCPEDKRILDVSEERYRDNGLLRYWFRGVEKFAPWVRKVHFITCGQKPDWLNTECSKLNWVKHSDYIPQECLPVFSSHPIELMMHKIPDLAEHFVYFNDDFFLTAPVKKDFFFKNGLPCDTAALNIISCTDFMGHILLNNLDEINKRFTTKKVICHAPLKWLSFRNGIVFLRSLLLLPWSRLSGFFDPHVAQPYLKSSLVSVWNNCEKVLDKTMRNRFRSNSDVNQWIFRYWQLCSGLFVPKSMNGKKYFDLSQDITEIATAIKGHKYKEIIINDDVTNDVDEKMKIINEAFDKILLGKSSFEK